MKKLQQEEEEQKRQLLLQQRINREERIAKRMRTGGNTSSTSTSKTRRTRKRSRENEDKGNLIEEVEKNTEMIDPDNLTDDEILQMEILGYNEYEYDVNEAVEQKWIETILENEKFNPTEEELMQVFDDIFMQNKHTFWNPITGATHTYFIDSTQIPAKDLTRAKSIGYLPKGTITTKSMAPVHKPEILFTKDDNDNYTKRTGLFPHHSKRSKTRKRSRDDSHRSESSN